MNPVQMKTESGDLLEIGSLAKYQVTQELMAAASKRAVFMHCLPAHRGQEVSEAAIDGARSVVFEQAANRLPTEQAILQAPIDGRWE